MNPTVYVHDLDPVIWQITDSIALRWYGLAYLMGFIGGYYLLSWLSRRKLYPVPQDRMADFVTYVAIFGVLIGGRLGYVLFYQIPNHGWSQFRDRIEGCRYMFIYYRCFSDIYPAYHRYSDGTLRF